MYKRILLKFSGEVLAGAKGYGIDSDVLAKLERIISSVHRLGVEVAIVIGGGNVFRGEQLIDIGIKPTTADNIGMLSTVMNALAMFDKLNANNITTTVMSAVNIGNGICEEINYNKADRILANKGVVIFCAGTGNPFFTTDSAAALRGVEIGADIVFKATKVDGIYDSDPMVNDNAKKFDVITFDEAITRNLTVMDATAFNLCKNNNLPICVFNLLKSEDIIIKILQGENYGTMVVKG